MNGVANGRFAQSGPAWRARGLPVVYSCSGCSGGGQLSHYIAVQLDRRGLGRMSCIAGLSAGVERVLADLRAACHVIAFDGCDFQCARKCIELYGATWHRHYVIATSADRGIEAQAERFIARVLADLLQPLQLAG